MSIPFRRAQRRGAALLMALVALALVTILLSTITAQVVRQRQTLRQQQRQHQADWLARAGVELAAARLVANPVTFVEEKQELLPDAKWRIAVEKSANDSFTVAVDAQVGLADGRTVVRSLNKRFRRSETGDMVKLEALPDAK